MFLNHRHESRWGRREETDVQVHVWFHDRRGQMHVRRLAAPRACLGVAEKYRVPSIEG